MIIEILILVILIGYPLLLWIFGKKASEKKIDVSRFYLKDILLSLFTLLLFFIIDPKIYDKLDFEKIGKGMVITSNIFFGVTSIFFIPFFLAFIPKNNLHPKDASQAKEIFGFPVNLMPGNSRELLLFTVYIVTGVFFEELFCRQFIFYALNTTLHLHGDIILLVSSALFAIGHQSKKIKEFILFFILGLILGKAFQYTGNLFYPIVLHLFLNLTIVVLAFRRMKDTKNTSI